MLSFLFVDKRELFVMKLAFEELCYYQQVLILKFAFGIEKLPGLLRNRPRWKAVLCFICRVCIQNQSINNFENDKLQD